MQEEPLEQVNMESNSAFYKALEDVEPKNPSKKNPLTGKLLTNSAKFNRDHYLLIFILGLVIIVGFYGFLATFLVSRNLTNRIPQETTPTPTPATITVIPNEPIFNGWKDYKNDALGFSLKMNPDWTVRELVDSNSNKIIRFLNKNNIEIFTVSYYTGAHDFCIDNLTSGTIEDKFLTINNKQETVHLCSFDNFFKQGLLVINNNYINLKKGLEITFNNNIYYKEIYYALSTIGYDSNANLILDSAKLNSFYIEANPANQTELIKYQNKVYSNLNTGLIYLDLDLICNNQICSEKYLQQAISAKLSFSSGRNSDLPQSQFGNQKIADKYYSVLGQNFDFKGIFQDKEEYADIFINVAGTDFTTKVVRIYNSANTVTDKDSKYTLKFHVKTSDNIVITDGQIQVEFSNKIIVEGKTNQYGDLILTIDPVLFANITPTPIPSIGTSPEPMTVSGDSPFVIIKVIRSGVYASYPIFINDTLLVNNQLPISLPDKPQVVNYSIVFNNTNNPGE